MKRVRAVLGAAVPALGMMVMPAAVAHASSTRKASIPAAHANVSVQPLIACGKSGNHTNASVNGTFHAGFDFDFSTRCVAYQKLWVTYAGTGLGGRARYRSAGGTLLSSRWAGTITIGAHSTYWKSSPKLVAYQVCQAMTTNSNKNDVLFGPLCAYTS